MKFYEYFKIFLNIENDLSEYMKFIEYNNKSKNFYTIKQSLLLLETCPIIESLMIDLCINSNTIKNHELYNWKYNWKIYKKKDKEQKVLEKDGKRQIENFPKFSYVCEKVFKLSEKQVKFYYNEKLQFLPDDSNYEILKPFVTLNKFANYSDFDDEKKDFPIGLETPKWWIAYNKIKHNFEESLNRVNYNIIIEAIAGLFLILSYCDRDDELLEKNGFIINRENKKYVKTRYFECEIT